MSAWSAAHMVAAAGLVMRAATYSVNFVPSRKAPNSVKNSYTMSRSVPIAVFSLMQSYCLSYRASRLTMNMQQHIGHRCVSSMLSSPSYHKVCVCDHQSVASTVPEHWRWGV